MSPFRSREPVSLDKHSTSPAFGRSVLAQLKKAKANCHHSSPAPVFKFGLVADVQYAVKEPHTKVHGKGRGKIVRRFGWNESLVKLASAVRTWNLTSGMAFVLSLGDIIEGNESYMEDLSERELKAVLDVLSNLNVPVRHILGNHCRRLCKKTLLRLLDLSSSYYDFAPAPGWRVVCLDTTELCAAAVDASDEEKHAVREMAAALGRGAQNYHGAMGDTQLAWFASVLREARGRKERVIIMTHYPLKEGSARKSKLAVNSAAILDCMEKSGCHIVAVFAGHDHSGGCIRPDNGVGGRDTAFVTLPAMVESPHLSNAFATVSVYDDGTLIVAGYGSAPSYKIRPG